MSDAVSVCSSAVGQQARALTDASRLESAAACRLKELWGSFRLEHLVVFAQRVLLLHHLLPIVQQVHPGIEFLAGGNLRHWHLGMANWGGCEGVVVLDDQADVGDLVSHWNKETLVPDGGGAGLDDGRARPTVSR